MDVKTLTPSFIARRNIRRNPGRSFSLMLVITLLAFFLFAGSVLAVSLSNGAQSTANRLGADIMIVPAGYDPHVDSILLAGKPSTFYLPQDTITRLDALADSTGIDLMTPQTFLATLRASCCSYPVQLVGLDYESDFIVRPWLNDTIHRDLQDGEVIVGYHVTGWPGDTLTFFGQDLRVAGRLEQTGMGFDAMIFMNTNTIAMLSREAERITGRKMRNDGSLVSVVMLKLKPGYDSVASSIEINRALNDKGIYALFSKKFVNSIGDSLKTVSLVINWGLAALWVVSVVVVGLIFSMMFAERRREFAVLRTIGADRSRLVRVCLAEVLALTVYGSLLGVVLGNALVAAGSPFVVEALHLPFLLPPLGELLMFTAGSLCAAIVTGLLASLLPVLKASRVDIMDVMRGA